jgi:ribosomal protein L12E/L44/L45/RPP1/RPP2
MKFLHGSPFLLVLTSLTVTAQTIERVKMTDGDLTCQQIYLETVDMDTLIAKNKTLPAATATGSVTANQVAGVATQAEGAANIAQTAATVSAYSGGLGGFGAAVGLGALGSIFGGAAKIAQGAAAQRAAEDAAVLQKMAAEQQAIVQTANQAQARKDHVTSLFLSKGCKMSEIQK